MALEIYEGSGGDISTVFAYFTKEAYDALPDPEMGKYGKPEKAKCDHWSCFDGSYLVNHEQEFIKMIDKINPGKYSHYIISWTNCN